MPVRRLFEHYIKKGAAIVGLTHLRPSLSHNSMFDVTLHLPHGFPFSSEEHVALEMAAHKAAQMRTSHYHEEFTASVVARGDESKEKAEANEKLVKDAHAYLNKIWLKRPRRKPAEPLPGDEPD